MVGIAALSMVRRKEERLDWMYAGGLAAKEDASKRQEEALLGKVAGLAPTNSLLPQQPGEVSKVSMANLPLSIAPVQPQVICLVARSSVFAGQHG